MLGPRQAGVRADAAVRELRPMRQGIEVVVARMELDELGGQRCGCRQIIGTAQRGKQVLGEGNLRGRGVHALAGAIETLAQRVHFCQIPPTAQPETDRLGSAWCEAAISVQLLEGTPGRRKVAPVAVEKIEVAKPAARQRLHVVDDHLDQRGGPQAHGAREAQIELRRPQRECGSDQRAGEFTHGTRDRFRRETVGTDQSRGAVLLGGAQRNHHALRAL